MPPFRYLGNILGCAGVRFGLGEGSRRLRLRALAPTKVGWLMQMGLVLHASALIGQYRPGPLRPFARVLTSEMFVWHAA